MPRVRHGGRMCVRAEVRLQGASWELRDPWWPRTSSYHQKPEEARKLPSLQDPEGARPSCTLIFRHLACKTSRQ